MTQKPLLLALTGQGGSWGDGASEALLLRRGEDACSETNGYINDRKVGNCSIRLT